MGGCCERRGRKSAAKRQARKCRKQRQDAAKLSLAVRYGSREAREDVVVARGRVRMGMGRSGWSLRGDTAYTDPFPSTLRKLVILVEPCSLALLYTSFSFHGGEAGLGYRELAMAQTLSNGLAYASKTLREPLAKTMPALRSYKDSSRICSPSSRIPKHAEVFAARPQRAITQRGNCVASQRLHDHCIVATTQCEGPAEK